MYYYSKKKTSVFIVKAEQVPKVWTNKDIYVCSIITHLALPSPYSCYPIIIVHHHHRLDGASHQAFPQVAPQHGHHLLLLAFSKHLGHHLAFSKHRGHHLAFSKHLGHHLLLAFSPGPQHLAIDPLPAIQPHLGNQGPIDLP